MRKSDVEILSLTLQAAAFGQELPDQDEKTPSMPQAKTPASSTEPIRTASRCRNSSRHADHLSNALMEAATSSQFAGWLCARRFRSLRHPCRKFSTRGGSLASWLQMGPQSSASTSS
jgi:hypothetical protein